MILDITSQVRRDVLKQALNEFGVNLAKTAQANPAAASHLGELSHAAVMILAEIATAEKLDTPEA